MAKILLPLDKRAKALARPPGKGVLRLNSTDGVAEVFIYGEIGGWWDGVDAEAVVRDIAALEADTITVRINSPGGSVFDGVSIYNALAAHPAEVVVQIEGVAASIASIIAMAGDKIMIGEAANIMIHKPWSFAVGDAEAMRKEAEVLDTLEAGLLDLYAARTGKKVDEIKPLLAAETWYRGQEAIDAGFADELMPAKKKKAPKSELLALFAHTPDDLLDEKPRPEVHEFERLLREGERVPNAFATRVAALAAKIFSPARDEQEPAPRDEDGAAKAAELKALAAYIRHTLKS